VGTISGLVGINGVRGQSVGKTRKAAARRLTFEQQRVYRSTRVYPSCQISMACRDVSSISIFAFILIFSTFASAVGDDSDASAL